MEKISLSTVTPVYQGARYLRELVAELEAVRTALAREQSPLELLEAIFVDDAAIDTSAEVLAELQADRPWLRVVHLSRNFGQHAATAAGILHSSGDWVATLDEDLQHHPRHLVPLLLEACRHHHDVVYASATGSVHRSAFRNVSSRLYKLLVGWLAGNPSIRKFSSFRVIRGSIARAAASVSTHDTYLDVVITWFTNRLASLDFPLHDIRSEAGNTSAYTLRRLLRHARRMLISSEIKLLRIGGAIGGLALLTSTVLGCATLTLKLFYPERITVAGWASLFLAVSFFGGLISLLVSIVLEYLTTLLIHAEGKPPFFVVERNQDAVVVRFAEQEEDQ